MNNSPLSICVNARLDCVFVNVRFTCAGQFMHACPWYQTCACGGLFCTRTCIHNVWGGGFPIKLIKLDHTMSSSSCARITLLRDKQLLRRYELSQIKFIRTYCITWGIPGSYLSGSSPPQSDSYHHSVSPELQR